MVGRTKGRREGRNISATTSIKSYHGSSAGTSADVTAIRFKLADNDTADTDNRIPIPSTGTQYSYLKHLALACSTSPSSLIDTVQVYGDGSLPTGVGIFIRDHAYSDPTSNEDTELSGFDDNYTDYTSSAPLSVAGSISNPSTGKITTNYIQMQMSIATTASAGVMSDETLTVSYLES